MLQLGKWIIQFGKSKFIFKGGDDVVIGIGFITIGYLNY